jgi:ribA/ribD-fused uncharacterized protein
MNINWENLPEILPEDVEIYLAKKGLKADLLASSGDFSLRKELNAVNTHLSVQHQLQVLNRKERIRNAEFDLKSADERALSNKRMTWNAKLAVAKEEMRLLSIESFYDKVFKKHEFAEWDDDFVKSINYIFTKPILDQRNYMSENEKFIFFHKNDNCFKTCYATRLVIEDRSFSSVYHYILYAKTAGIFNEEKRSNMLKDYNYENMTNLFYSNGINFNKKIWDFYIGQHLEVAYTALFTQDQKARNALDKSEGYTLALADPYDHKWGIGLSRSSPVKFRRCNWKGKNLLGDLITRIRIQLNGSYGSIS